MTNTKLLALLLLGLWLSGCSTTITNLTPSQQTRNTTGLYPFEVLFHSNQQTLHTESIRPSVVIGLEAFPMQPAPVLKNRWESMVPVPADKKSIHYRYKFDYEYNAIPVRRTGSILSPPYRLEIVDK